MPSASLHGTQGQHQATCCVQASFPVQRLQLAFSTKVMQPYQLQGMCSSAPFQLVSTRHCKFLLSRRCHGNFKRQVTRMMPIGVPRVPYRTPKEGGWQWVDIWNCLVRTFYLQNQRHQGLVLNSCSDIQPALMLSFAAVSRKNCVLGQSY